MKHNFFAGPAILPQEVIKQSAAAVLEFENMGLSILEISHRSKPFIAVMDEAIQLTKYLLSIPDDYEVIFLGGGASTQFGMVPMNMLNDDEFAAYIDTGTWSSKAIKDAKLFGHIDIVASSKDQNYSYIPKKIELVNHHKFLHFTSNNTIFGTQFHEIPDVDIPLVSDMSSDIFSRRLPIEKFDLIYAGAQKNMGPAGVTLVILKKSILDKVSRKIPAMMNYSNHVEGVSMYNTPPVFPVYVSLLNLRWIKNIGGLEMIEKRNKAKADLLWNEIDRNPFFHSPTNVDDRSLMNICFLLKEEKLITEFTKMYADAGCVGLEGHRSVGGFRASIYNAMELESVQVLVDVMQHLEKSKG